MTPSSRRIEIFADGADLRQMLEVYRARSADGFTTNPTLMAKAGVRGYREFAREALGAIRDLPISFEVFADDFDEMRRQAREIASWGTNVFVKIPITNTRGESSIPVIEELSAEGLKLNATAIMSLGQVEQVIEATASGTPMIVSVFAGRIADTGRDPVPFMRQVVEMCAPNGKLKVLWASPREVLNFYQAEACGCQIVTLTPDLMAKLPLRDRDLVEFSRETVQMFYDDARRAGYEL